MASGAWAAPLAGKLKVGIALGSPAGDLGWTKQHALGVSAIKTLLGDRVEINMLENVFQPQDAERVFRGFATSGHQLVLGTSFSHSVSISRIAPQFPAIAFDCCAGTKVLANLGAFEARYYEGSYVAGVAAARMSKTGKLGFVGGFPVPDIVGPANAFLLGAQSVKPGITCSILFLNSWSDPGKEKDATLALIAQGCDVINAMTDTPVAAQTAEQKGVWAIGYASDVRKYAPTRLLTSLMLDWSSLYVQDAKDIVAGVWKPQSRWHGLKEGVVRLSPYLESIPADTRALLVKTDEAIKAGALQVYRGEIKDQAGGVRVPAGAVLTENEVRGMNWLVAGMQGRLKG